VFWLDAYDPEGPLLSGDFILDEVNNTLTQQREYICGLVGSGSFGNVLRVSRNAGTGSSEHYAVKFFWARDEDDDASQHYQSEYDSVQEVVTSLSRDAESIREEFGESFQDLFCVLDQETSKEALDIKRWLNSIGEARFHLVLKTLPYDAATFCARVTQEQSKPILENLVKLCAYFYYYGLRLYTDWKPENFIWAGDKMMLVDIVLMEPRTEDPLVDVYYYCLSRNNERVKQMMYLYGSEKVFYDEIIVNQKENPTWPIAGMYNTCQMFTRNYTEPTPVVFNPSTKQKIFALIENKEGLSKKDVGDALLRLNNMWHVPGGGGGAVRGGRRAASIGRAVVAPDGPVRPGDSHHDVVRPSIEIENNDILLRRKKKRSRFEPGNVYNYELPIFNRPKIDNAINKLKGALIKYDLQYNNEDAFDYSICKELIDTKVDTKDPEYHLYSLCTSIYEMKTILQNEKISPIKLHNIKALYNLPYGNILNSSGLREMIDELDRNNSNKGGYYNSRLNWLFHLQGIFVVVASAFYSTITFE
jgi:hypothetical protein